MNKDDPCPCAIKTLVSTKFRRQIGHGTREDCLSAEFFKSNTCFMTKGIVTRLSDQTGKSFFNYQVGMPDALYVCNKDKVLIECKRYYKNSGSNKSNGCDVRNGLLQLVEYCRHYGIKEGILVVFDAVGVQVDKETRNLVLQFHDFLGVEIHMVWISKNITYDEFV